MNINKEFASTFYKCNKTTKLLDTGVILQYRKTINNSNYYYPFLINSNNTNSLKRT